MIRLGVLWPVLQLFPSDNNSNEILIQTFGQSLKPYNKLKTYLHFYKPIFVSSSFEINMKLEDLLTGMAIRKMSFYVLPIKTCFCVACPAVLT